MKNGWQVTTLSEVCQIKPPKSEARKRANPDSLVSFAPMEDLGIDRKFLNATKTKELSSVVGSYTYFADGDVLLAKITPCFQNGKLGIASDLSNGIGFGSSEFIVFRPNGSLDREYLYYYLSRENFRREGVRQMGGAVGHQRIPKEFIEGYPIPIPPLPEQRRIVGILDEAFAGIATAKANAEQNLQNARALFESHLQYVFSERGTEWDRITLAELLERGWIESHLDGNHGGDYPRKHEFISEGVPYISANCLNDERIEMSKAKYLSPDRAALLRKGIAKDGDVLFAHNATVGPIAILHTDEEKVILGTSLTYYRCNREYILPRYLAHYMRSFGFKSQYLQVMRQSTRNQVPITKQREFYHVIPPLKEQTTIVDQLDGLFDKGRELGSIYQRKIELLDELKQSLLHRAFSGELTSRVSVSVLATFPAEIPGITTTDLHAGILAMGYQLHEQNDKLQYFGHVKAEKIAHLVEAHLGINLGRVPVKAAAGPNDYPHLKKVEHRAKKAGYFDFQRVTDSQYKIKKLSRFEQHLLKTREKLGERLTEVEELLEQLLPLNTEQAEILATVYSGWNNLLLDEKNPSDEEIVVESRENWHPDKLQIDRDRFFKAIEWMRKVDFVPKGRGRRVDVRV